MSRSWSEQELREVIEAFGNPMCFTRGEKIVAVNDAYCRTLGHPRSHFEGAHALSVVPLEERHHVAEMLRRRVAHEAPLYAHRSLRMNTVDAHGVRRRWMVMSRAVAAADGLGEYLLVNCVESPEEASDLDQAEALVQIAAGLVAARSEMGVRERVLQGFERANMQAAIYRVNRDNALEALVPRPGIPSADVELAREAFVERRPVFYLAPGRERFTVYVPVIRADSDSELLVFWDSGFTTAHTSLISLFAQQLSATLESSRTFAQLQERNDELSLLLDLARTTSGTLDLATILDVACDFLVKLLDVSNVFILLLDKDRKALHAAASSREHREYFRRVVIPLDSDSVAATAARRGIPLAVEDTGKTRVFRSDLVERFNEKAILALPLTARHEVIGSIVVDDTRGPRHFGDEFVSLALATVGQIALSVHNAQLYESLKDSYAQLAATRAEMVKQERLAALGELSAIVAHEVRNPLGVIFNAVSSLRRINQKDPDSAMLLDIVKEECERLNRMVGDLLDFSRPTELSVDQEDLGELLKESVDAALVGHGDGRWRVDLNVHPGLTRLPIDHRMMRQALVNVLVNAMQAMPRGGSVQVTAAIEDRCARIDIRDEGPGVPPEVRARMFEPFFTTKAKGTGLGLAVVKRIVEDHGGSVSLASEAGQGATFTLKLPLFRQTETGSGEKVAS